jgi:hypothetical protein
MSDRLRGKTYRVVGIRRDGSRVFVDGSLAIYVADALRAVMLSKFPDVLIEEERPGIGMERKHALFDAGIPDALNVLGGADPEVDCPNLRAEFAVQKD